MFLFKDFEGETVAYFSSWSILIFIGAADCKIPGLFLARLNTSASTVIMILRVWVMYNQSRLILGILLVFYAISIISYLVDRVIGAKILGMWEIISYYARCRTGLQIIE